MLCAENLQLFKKQIAVEKKHVTVYGIINHFSTTILLGFLLMQTFIFRIWLLIEYKLVINI